MAFFTRLPEEVDKKLTDYAKKNFVSKNQAIIKAVMDLLEKEKTLNPTNPVGMGGE